MKYFRRLPTKEEWSRSRKYARGIRVLKMDTSIDLVVTQDVLLALQLRTGNETLLPRLERFVCKNTTGDFIPSIPLFLSPKTTDIIIKFNTYPSTVMLALTIARFPTLCPHIKHLSLEPLPRNPTMIEAVSDMLLACNRDTLQWFFVDSPLTEDARGILYKLPKLRGLWATMQGPTSLPLVELPDLETICVRWDTGCDWLQGFRGAKIGKLKAIDFRPTSGSAKIADFLEEFQSVVLTTSAQTSLSEFSFCTSQSWTPNYSSLLAFKQMTKLEIEFSCYGGCSSRVGDDIIINLAQAMPELEILQLGNQPCKAVTGVTFKGLIVLALRCPRLSKLRVHLQANKLAEATSRIGPLFPSEPTAVIPQTNCALTDLQVGETPISGPATLAVSLTLLQIFPEIHNIEYLNSRWGSVAEPIKLFKRIGGHIHHASKTHLSPFLR